MLALSNSMCTSTETRFRCVRRACCTTITLLLWKARRTPGKRYPTVTIGIAKRAWLSGLTADSCIRPMPSFTYDVPIWIPSAYFRASLLMVCVCARVFVCAWLHIMLLSECGSFQNYVSPIPQLTNCKMATCIVIFVYSLHGHPWW